MKFSAAWLREWVNSDLSKEEWCDRLTMTGLEVDGVHPVAEKFSGVVVAKILNIKKHPQAEQLHLCEVDIGTETPLSIVCAATNIKVGMKAPLAQINAVLPQNKIIKETVIRNITSQGMLCSATDIGLAEESEGLLDLPKDAPLGVDIWEYFALTDDVIDVAITPNRGDCLSIKGLARELAAVTQTSVKKFPIPEVKPVITETFPVTIEAQTACPRYVGRVIRGVKTGVMTPLWMKEKLRRSGIRSISPLVDVTNYVMVELGQPMHAFDLTRLEKKMNVRMATKDEELVLLDGSVIKLDEATVVIADSQKPLAIAGVMGGMDSGISAKTEDIFLESAFFSPANIARQRQTHHLNSESAYRFERGVDPQLQRAAIERATRLIMNIVGGNPGPVIDTKNPELISPKTIFLRRHRISDILGSLAITDKEIKDIFSRLGFGCKKEKQGWQIEVPSWRFDITLEIDLIEEIARLYGYDKITPTRPAFPTTARVLSENRIALPRARKLLCDLGYHEVVTYSFVSSELQALFDPQTTPKTLMNPITVDMSVMRTNLWPGLIGTYLYNRDRQQTRLRLFEMGLCFLQQPQRLLQESVLGGLVSGPALAEQWGAFPRDVDFFDVKGQIENILQLTHLPQNAFRFEPHAHPALHPEQAAFLYKEEEYVGVFGAVHPAICQKLDILEPIFLFQFNLDSILGAKPPYFSEISRFPEIRRDVALLVDRHISSQQIQDAIIKSGGDWLRQVTLFDVYLGDGVAEEKKSVAFSLILQHATRTLRDEEIADTVEGIIKALNQTLGIELRG